MRGIDSVDPLIGLLMNMGQQKQQGPKMAGGRDGKSSSGPQWGPGYYDKLDEMNPWEQIRFRQNEDMMNKFNEAPDWIRQQMQQMYWQNQLGRMGMNMGPRFSGSSMRQG